MATTIPWEDPSRGVLARFWATVSGATTDPVGTFTRIGAAEGERDLSSGVSFALLTAAVGWAPFVLLSPCLAVVPFAFGSSLPDDLRAIGTGAMCGMVGAMPFVLLLGSVGVELVHAVIFHGIAALLGGVGDFRRSFHAMLYTSAIRFWLLPALFLGFVPFVGSMVHLGVRMAFVIWAGFACYGAARGAHGLDDQRALVVAILTPLVSIGIVSFCIAALVFALVLAFAGSLGLGGVLPGVFR